MEERKNNESKANEGMPVIDPFAILETLSGGRYYDPLRRVFRRRLIKWARELEES